MSAHTTSAGGRILVAYVVPAGEAPAMNTIRDFLATELPAVMVPSAFVVLERLPLTPSGKVDRRALPAPELDAFATSDYAPPRNEIEKTLCRLFEQVLGVPRVGIHDDFFALGGNSLMGVRLVAAIREAMHTAVSLRTLHECPTVAKLAAHLGADTHREVEL